MSPPSLRERVRALWQTWLGRIAERRRHAYVMRRADAARARFEARNARLAREAAEQAHKDDVQREAATSADAVAAAIARAKARRAAKDEGR